VAAEAEDSTQAGSRQRREARVERTRAALLPWLRGSVEKWKSPIRARDLETRSGGERGRGSGEQEAKKWRARFGDGGDGNKTRARGCR
jgi:hypothetical protein